MICKMARDGDENIKDVKGGILIKEKNGKLLTEQEAVVKICESYFKELLNWEGNNKHMELPSYVDGKLELTDITYRQTGMKGVKKGRAPCIEEMRVEMVMAAGKVESVGK